MNLDQPVHNHDDLHKVTDSMLREVGLTVDDGGNLPQCVTLKAHRDSAGSRARGQPPERVPRVGGGPPVGTAVRESTTQNGAGEGQSAKDLTRNAASRRPRK